MSRVCSIRGTRYQAGNNVSHSNRKTRRRFVPNLHNVSFFSNILGRKLRLRVTNATLRTIDKNGGIDGYLVKAATSELKGVGLELKREIDKKIANNA